MGLAMKAHSVTYEIVSAIARKYAAARGHDVGAKVGADVLVAALAKALGADAAVPILAEAGLREAARFVEMVPDADAKEAQTLPALVPDAHLVSLLKGDLKPFREGGMGAMEALRVLLAPGRLPQDTLKALGGGDAAIIQIEDRGLFDTRLFTRSLAHVYQSLTEGQPANVPRQRSGTRSVVWFIGSCVVRGRSSVMR